MGFSIPIGEWMRNELREMAENTFAKLPFPRDVASGFKFWHAVTRSEASALTFSAILEILNMFLLLDYFLTCLTKQCYVLQKVLE